MAKTRRAYTGGAASTTTSSNILSSGTTSFTITAYTGWPYGVDPFFVVVEPGSANEEKILVTRTGSTDTTINVYATPSVAANRGADGTSSVAHSSGVTVFPVFTALDADEANELTSAFGSKGDLVSYGSSTFETLGVGSNDEVLIADSGEASGLKWGSVDTAQLADDAVTGPKLANATVETKTASYTLVAGDRNKRIVMNNAGATTITVDDSVFSAGDVVWLHNIGAGTCTVTAGTATVNTAASLDLAQWEGGSLYFTSASSAIFFRGPAAGVAVVSTEYLVQGGGGQANGSTWCGGGAGGCQLSNYGGNPLYLERGTAYTVTIGAGGSYSELAGIVADPGARGGAGATGARQGEGSNGGGGSANSLPGGAGRGKNGYNGGNGSSQSCGGGAGAGANGSNASGTTGGNGGAGLSNSITGSAVGRGGGGGGGGTGAGGTASDGGGAGSSGAGTGSNGTANTGGGAGGTGNATGTGVGGSGVVIIRFPTAEGSPTIGAGLTSSSTTDGTDTVITFTAGTDTITWST